MRIGGNEVLTPQLVSALCVKLFISFGESFLKRFIIESIKNYILNQ